MDALHEINFSGIIEHPGTGRVTLTTETSADWIFFMIDPAAPIRIIRR
jgi:hypothetical protein